MSDPEEVALPDVELRPLTAVAPGSQPAQAGPLHTTESEHHRQISVHGRWCCLSSLLFLVPSGVSYSEGLYLHAAALVIITIASVNLWRDWAPRSPRRYVDIACARMGMLALLHMWLELTLRVSPWFGAALVASVAEIVFVFKYAGVLSDRGRYRVSTLVHMSMHASINASAVVALLLLKYYGVRIEPNYS